MATVDRDDKLALPVLLSVLSLVHQQVLAFLETFLQWKVQVCVAIVAPCEVNLLLYDLGRVRDGRAVVLYLCQHQLDPRVFVGATHCLVDEARISLINSDDYRVCDILVERKLYHAKVSVFVLISHCVVVNVLIVVADSRDVEKVQVVSVRDPEETVVFVLQVDLTLGVLRPLVTFIAPSSLPLLLAPGIPYLNQSLSLAVVESDNFGADETVSVGVDETYGLHFLGGEVVLCLAGNGRAHWELLLVCIQDQVPELFGLSQVIMEEELVWAAGQRVHGLASRTCLDSLVAPKDFGPYFL